MSKNDYTSPTFPTSALTLLRSHREQINELAEKTDFFDSAYGYRRLAHFANLDDLLIHLFYVENKRLPGSERNDNILERHEVLGPAHAPVSQIDLEIQNRRN